MDSTITAAVITALAILLAAIIGRLATLRRRAGSDLDSIDAEAELPQAAPDCDDPKGVDVEIHVTTDGTLSDNEMESRYDFGRLLVDKLQDAGFLHARWAGSPYDRDLLLEYYRVAEPVVQAAKSIAESLLDKHGLTLRVVPFVHPQMHQPPRIAISLGRRFAAAHRRMLENQRP